MLGSVKLRKLHFFTKHCFSKLTKTMHTYGLLGKKKHHRVSENIGSVNIAEADA